MIRLTGTLVAGAVLVGAILAGCGTARLISRDQYSGVFALDGDRDDAMKDASTQITGICGGPFTVVSEGEEVIGTDTFTKDTTYTTPDGRVVNKSGESTRQATEWRIHYQCGGQAPVGQPPGPPTAAPEAGWSGAPH